MIPYTFLLKSPKITLKKGGDDDDDNVGDDDVLAQNRIVFPKFQNGFDPNKCRNFNERDPRKYCLHAKP